MKHRKIPLWILAALASIPIVLFVIAFAFSSDFMLDYKDFKIDLANSVNYANDNDSLRAEYQGTSTRVTVDNSQTIYETLTYGGTSFADEEMPEGEPILFDFGNGAIMKIWKRDAESVTVHYITPEEEEILFSTVELCRFTDFERLVSTDWGNSEWE